MLIIVEGPDGAGKSTAVQELTMALWYEDRGTVLINPKRSPRQSPVVEYVERLNWYQPGSGVDLILDRSWYSENVYGPIWRDAGLRTGDLMRCEAWARSQGAVVAYLDQPDDVLLDRVRGDRLADDEDAEWMGADLVKRYAAAYRAQAPRWDLPIMYFDHHTPFSAEAVIQQAEYQEENHS